MRRNWARYSRFMQGQLKDPILLEQGTLKSLKAHKVRIKEGIIIRSRC